MTVPSSTVFPSKERLLALEILSQALKGKKLDRVFDEVVSGASDSGSRVPQIYNLVYGVSRRYYPLSLYISFKVKKDPGELTRLIMMMALYELAYNESSKAYAVVDQALKLCDLMKQSNYKPLVNAILRGFLRNIDNAKKIIEASPILPEDMMKEMKKTFPELKDSREEKKMISYFTRPAPIFLSVNTLNISRDKLYERLSSQGIELEKVDYDISGAVTNVDAGVNAGNGSIGTDGASDTKVLSGFIQTLKTFDPRVFKTPEFNEGLFFVQDLSSQIAVRLLEPKKFTKILDLCSAPGGKAMNAAVLSNDDASISAVDVSSSRLIKLYENLRRLKLKSITVFNQDILASELHLGADPVRTESVVPAKADSVLSVKAGSFDRIFLDPPCTALGVITRNPDLIWAKKTSLMEELGTLQLKMLVKAMETFKAWWKDGL
jgi:16S rRNA (cytosine967-C5)-methyltransferase